MAGSEELSFLLANDLGARKTSKYSNEGFATYIVDRNGKIAATMPGTKMRRPTPKKILKALKASGAVGAKDGSEAKAGAH